MNPASLLKMTSLKNLTGFLLIAALQILATKAITSCYFASYATYRSGDGKFEAEDIDVTLCDHVIYSFVGINTDGSIKVLDKDHDITKRGFERFTDLKKKNDKLKTLVSIGGWDEGSTKFSKVVSNEAVRKTFIKKSVDFLKKYKFDGMDIDWEYPAQRGGSSSDKQNFANLCKEMRKEFDRSGFLLTAAVFSEPTDKSYDVKSLSDSLHYIHVMTYDIHESTEKVTGENAPLNPSNVDKTDYAKTRNVKANIKAWIEKGATPSKLIMGLGFYGVSYTLADPNKHDIGSPTKGPGQPGPLMKEKGELAYNEICKNLKDGGWTEQWSNEQKVPFAFKGDQWVGYDNPKSIAAKISFGKSVKLGGYMVWAIDMDDFRGTCGSKYPLLKAVKKNSA